MLFFALALSYRILKSIAKSLRNVSKCEHTFKTILATALV